MERVIKTIIRGAWCLLGLAIVGAVVAFTAIWFGWIGYMPDIDDLQNPISRYATQVYSSDGQILGTAPLLERVVGLDVEAAVPVITHTHTD